MKFLLENYVELLQFHRDCIPLSEFLTFKAEKIIALLSLKISQFSLGDNFSSMFLFNTKVFSLVVFSFYLVLSENSRNKIFNYDLLALFRAFVFRHAVLSYCFFVRLFINTNSLSSNYQHLLIFINNFFPATLSRRYFKYSRLNREKNNFNYN